MQEIDKKIDIQTEIDSQKEGAIAAKAFALFRFGMKPDEVVIILEEPPEKIMKLYNQWIAITHRSSGLLHDLKCRLAEQNCKICGDNIEPLNLVVGYSNKCNHTIFFGPRADQEMVRKSIGFEKFIV